MPSLKLDLKSRQQFAELELAAKNDYIQSVAKLIADYRGEPFVPLDKDALSRIRRFYARRALGELALDKMSDTRMRDCLARLAESIRLDVVEKVIRHEVSGDGAPLKLVRPAPDVDDQLSFFVPSAFDAPLKDDLNLMDVAPFALSKSTQEGVIRYELKDALITVEGGAAVGLANAYDYDIVINMVSHLAEAMNRYRTQEAKGLHPTLPPRTYRPAASEILRFCRRELGGKQYLDLERALDRLQATRIKITNLAIGKRRETQSFPLIGRYKVVSRSAMNRIDLVEIDIPNWVYEGIVKPEGKPSILTLNPDYFLINRPIAKFIYRLARKSAGEGVSWYSMKEVWKRSGSKLPFKKFQVVVNQIVAGSKAAPLPDYDLDLEPGANAQLILHMKFRQPPKIAKSA